MARRSVSALFSVRRSAEFYALRRFTVPFLFAGVLSFANAVLLYFILPETVKKGASLENLIRKSRFAEILEVLREKVFGTLAAIYFVLITSFSIMTYAFVLYTMHRFEYSAEQNGLHLRFYRHFGGNFSGRTFRQTRQKIRRKSFDDRRLPDDDREPFSIPFIGPTSGGLAGLLIMTTVLAVGNSLASPSIMSLASKVSHENEQGKALGVLQSGASLARAIGRDRRRFAQ